MSQDQIQFEILADGTISVTTDQVSGQNHVSADQLLKQLDEVCGGPVTIKKRPKGHTHTHHGHQHHHHH